MMNTQTKTYKLSLVLTMEQKNALDELCKGTGKTPADVLTDFVADLTGTFGNGGSDERMYAVDWFNRRGYPFGAYL